MERTEGEIVIGSKEPVRIDPILFQALHEDDVKAWVMAPDCPTKEAELKHAERYYRNFME